MRIKKIDLMELLFILLVLSSEQFFYLVSFPIKNSDITLIISLLMFTLYITKYKGRGFKNNRNVNILFLILFAICIISSLRAYINYGQPFLIGIRPQRYFLIFLAYYPIRNIILKRKDGLNFVIRTVAYIGCLAVLLYILQYLVFNYIVFLSVNYDFRFGTVRLRFSEIITLFSMFYSFERSFNTRKVKFKIFFALHLIYYFLVVKGRFGIIVLLGTILLLICIYNRRAWKACLFIMIFVAIMLYAPIPILNTYLNAIREAIDSYQSQTDVRYLGQQYYINCLTSNVHSLLFGDGFVNNDFTKAVILSKSESYYVVDNGYIGISFYYGIIGAIWNILLYIKLIILNLKNRKVCQLDVGLGVSVFMLFASITCPYMFYFYYPVLLSILLSISDVISSKILTKS